MNPKKLNHVIQYSKEYSLCTGCHSCELVCSLVHDGVTGPCHGRIKLQLGNVKTMYHQIMSCQQCEDHPCYDCCPKKDSAMCVDNNGIVYINEKECIGCGKCVKNCKFTPSRINLIKSKDKTKRKAKKCDLCRNREEGPACVQYCPARCLGLSEEPLPYVVSEEKGEE
jgi:Fe-S-cluster-containing hydrogenase component 2